MAFNWFKKKKDKPESPKDINSEAVAGTSTDEIVEAAATEPQASLETSPEAQIDQTHETAKNGGSEADLLKVREPDP
jgi:hypothetical protein